MTTLPNDGTKQRAVVETIHEAAYPLTIREIAQRVPDDVYRDDDSKHVWNCLSKLQQLGRVEKADERAGSSLNCYRLTDEVIALLEGDRVERDTVASVQTGHVSLDQRRAATRVLADAEIGDKVSLARPDYEWVQPFVVLNPLDASDVDLPTSGEMQVSMGGVTGGDDRYVRIREDGTALLHHPDGATAPYPAVITEAAVTGRVADHVYVQLQAERMNDDRPEPGRRRIGTRAGGDD